MPETCPEVVPEKPDFQKKFFARSKLSNKIVSIELRRPKVSLPENASEPFQNILCEEDNYSKKR